MSESDRAVIIAELNDSNREAFKWLAVAQALDGQRCVFCGHLWDSRKSLEGREPIVAAKEPTMRYACEPCWKKGRRLCQECGYEKTWRLHYCGSEATNV